MSRARSNSAKSTRATVFRYLPTNESTYYIDSEPPFAQRAHHLPQYDTVLIPKTDRSRKYESDYRMPDSDVLRKLFFIHVKPHAQVKLLSYVLCPMEYSGEADQMPMLHALGVDHIVEQMIVPFWKRACAASERALKLSDRSQRDEYNAMRFALFTYFTIREQALDVWPFDTDALPREAKRLLESFMGSDRRYELLYFCPMLANDLLYYLPYWAKLVFRLLGKNWEKLIKLTLALWRDVSKFCFDDILAEVLRKLQLPVALSRGVQKIGVPGAGGSGDAATDALVEIEEDASPDDNSGQDTMQTASQALADRSIQEQEESCGKQGDDVALCKVRIMSEFDLETLVNNLDDCSTRFAGLATEHGRNVFLQMVRLYQRMCGQLRFCNTYCNSQVLNLLHAGNGNELWHTPTVRDEAIEKLLAMGLIYRFATRESALCLALKHVVRMETWLWCFFKRLMSLEAPHLAATHPFYPMTKDATIDWRQIATAKHGFDPSQCDALERLLSKRLVTIAGPPGTGKTFTLARTLRMIADSGLPVVWQMATPTCRSRKQLANAMRDAGLTFHKHQVSTAQRIIYHAKNPPAPPSKTAAPKGKAAVAAPTPKRRALEVPVRQAITLLGVDEASMWSSKLLYDLLQALEPQVMAIIGDLEQCTPIGWGRPFHVLSDFEQYMNNSTHQVNLQTVHRNSGDIRSLAQSISQNRVADFTGHGQRLVHHINKTNVVDELRRVNAVSAVDLMSELGNFVNAAATLSDQLQTLQPDMETFRPPLSFITYSTDESNKLNEHFQAKQRERQMWRHVALLGPNNQYHDRTRNGEPLVPPDWGTQNVMPKSAPSGSVVKAYRPWSLAVGDYVAFSGNVIDLHSVLGPGTDFIPVWAQRFLGANAATPQLRNLTVGADDSIANGDTGLVVQMYTFDPTHVCKHIPLPSQVVASETAPAAAAAASPAPSSRYYSSAASAPNKGLPKPSTYHCALCSKALNNSSCELAGPSFCVKSLVGFTNQELLRQWNVASKRMYLVVVVWLDNTNEVIHVPIPSYDYRKIKPGYSLSFFRAQGSQWPNVAFVCSNRWKPSGTTERNAYQKRMERARARQLVNGNYRIDGYRHNRRLFYVAATRARLRTLFLFELDYKSKLRQLMEHDLMPPSILEDLFSGDFEPDEELLEGMPVPAAAVLPATIIVNNNNNHGHNTVAPASDNMEVANSSNSSSSATPAVNNSASSQDGADDVDDDDWLLNVPLDAIVQNVSQPLRAGAKRPINNVH